MLWSEQTGAFPESSLAVTATAPVTVCPFGGKIDEGVAVTLAITGAVLSLTAGVRRNGAAAPLNDPSPTITPAALTPFACSSTQPGASMRELRSKELSASR